MRVPVMAGLIKRRLLVNFRADPGVVQRMLPRPFRPKLHLGHSVVGICLIRLERIRPAGWPALLGLSSENAAHRIAVEWRDRAGLDREGVFIPRRDTDSFISRIAGGRLFPGEHQPARFSVMDIDHHLEVSMRSDDGTVGVEVTGDEAEVLPMLSCFGSLVEASAFSKVAAWATRPRAAETVSMACFCARLTGRFVLSQSLRCARAILKTARNSRQVQWSLIMPW